MALFDQKKKNKLQISLFTYFYMGNVNNLIKITRTVLHLFYFPESYELKSFGNLYMFCFRP